MTAALLDTLLPGDGDFPSAGELDLGIADHERFGVPFAAVQDLLPRDFDGLSAEARTAILQEVEASHRPVFDAMVLGVYSLYYTHPRVTGVIRKLTGHSGQPPQPGGHDLAPFDPAMLAVPAARPPLYRPTPGTGHED